MNKARVDKVLKNLGEMGLEQVIVSDPLSIFWLTGPAPRFPL